MRSAQKRALFGAALAVVVAAAGAGTTANASSPGPAPVTRVLGNHGDPSAQLRGETDRPVLGLHRVTVVPVFWDTPGSATTAQINDVINAVDRNYNNWTAGKVRFMAGQVKPWTQISLTPTQVATCDLGAIERAARAAVGTTTADQFHHVVAYFPYNSACGFTGTGYVGTSPTGDGFAWINDQLDTGVWARSLGYNLGLDNGGSLACWSDPGHTTPATLSDYCQQTPLDDPWDVMGNTPYQPGFMSAANLEKLGVLEDASVTNIAWDQTVTLAPVESGAGLRSATVVNGPNTYYIEYRAPQGMDSWIDDATYTDTHGVVRTDPGGGVIVRRVRAGYGKAGEMDVLDFHPDTNLSTSDRHPGLDAGESYALPSGDVTLSVGSVTSTGAQVSVTFPKAAGIYRWSGSNRYAASAAISASSFRMRTPTVYIASGELFTDALSGAAVAGRVRSPLLLVSQDGISNDIKNELARLRPDRIVVLGGPATISDSVLATLNLFAPATRVSGSDRYATSAAISAANFASGVPVAYISSGLVFPDALAGAPIAGKTGGPMLLVKSTEIPTAIATELNRLKPAKIVVLGGSATIADSVEGALASYTTGTVERWEGADRYAVSAGISAKAFPSGSPTVFVASGAIFTDALSGAPVAGKTPAPLLLVKSSSIPTAVAAELTRLQARRIIVLGGPASVSTDVSTRLRAFLVK
ncbi:MAG: cell wall-binding repeat-containing protein [Dermatophilaceae bacterium]